MFKNFRRKANESPSAAPFPERLGEFHHQRIQELVGAVHRGEGDLHTFEDPYGNVYHSEVTKHGEALPEEYVRFIGERLASEHDPSIEYAGVTRELDKGIREVHIAVELANVGASDIIAARQMKAPLTLF
jgi:hypothetical protein